MSDCPASGRAVMQAQQGNRVYAEKNSNKEKREEKYIKRRRPYPVDVQ
jgi:hypothetical protein